MRRILTVLSVLSTLVADAESQVAWINEFHYNNEGSDAGEFVEVAFRSGEDLEGYRIVLYNGSNGQSYDSRAISTGVVTPGESVSLVVMDGFSIQNGSPDGIALVDNTGSILEFISYGGSFTATDGLVEGVTSVDIGAVETDETLPGHSLQRMGTGCSVSEFEWASSAAMNTMGDVNVDQTFTCSPGSGGLVSAWISEFHYDNEGSDTGEFVEVACTCSDLSGYTVVLYNGEDGGTYQTASLSSGDSVGTGITFAVADFSGVQNGGADGIALVDPSANVVEFISYEGTLVATAGPASGMQSTDIGVRETSSTPVGYSLQRSGVGCAAAEFAWLDPLPNTRGTTNDGQSFNCGDSAPTPALPPNPTPTNDTPLLSPLMSAQASGSGTLSASVSSGETVRLGYIPDGLADIFVEVDSIADVDIQLYSDSDTLVRRNDGLLRDANRASADWGGVRIEYSGFNGEQESGKEGQEFIFIAGELLSAVNVELLGSGGSDASVKVKFTWGYYESADGLTGMNLKNALHAIIDNHTELTYTPDCWEALKRSDQDPANPDNVIMLYSRHSIPKDNQYNPQVCSDCDDWWTREHVWAKSHGDFGTTKGPGTDIHALRASDKTVNTERSEKDFLEGGSPLVNQDARADCPLCLQTGQSFEPPDVVKGSVARMMFYMATRYIGGASSDFLTLELVEGIDTPFGASTEGAGTFGDLTTLLQWHELYPPTDEEYYRNNVVFQIQGNRNPFIDHPEWLCEIFDPQYQAPFDDVSSSAACSWTLFGICPTAFSWN